jgi:general secretion pathway protein D
MKYLTVCLALLLFVAVAPICHAQFDFGGDDQSSVPPPPPWTQFHLNPNVRVKLDFRNASVDAVIQMLSDASGVAIVKDPALTGGITLQSPKPQSLGDAFAMFSAVLDLKNADLTKQGNFLLIKVRPQQTGRGGNGYGGAGGYGAAAGGGGPGGGGTGRGAAVQTPVLQVYVLLYANATDLAKVINDVYASTTTNAANNGGFGGGGFGGAAAVQTAGGGGGGGGGRRGGAGIGGVSGDTVKASADDFSNSLVVNAPPRDQDEIAQIISSIDKPATQPQQTQVFKLQYALASDLETVVQNILTNTTALGRGSSSSSNQSRNNQGGGGGGFGGFFARTSNSSSSNNNTNGTVSEDTRTNSLVVTTTAQLMLQVTQVVASLDKPATYEGSTYLYVMQNARADVVANLLNEAFGNRTTNGPVGGALTTTGATQPTVTASTSNSSTTGSAPSSLSSATNRSGSSNSSQSVTSSSTSALETQGLNELDQIVNIRNLSGQVLLVPNIDTNSIIVVSPPEDWPILQQILQQMDQAPQQVMIDTLVVEASLDKSDQLGVEFNVNAQNAFGGLHGLSNFEDTGLGSASTGFNYTLTAGQYQVFLQAAATDTKFNVLSTPRIFTTNNATAQINISQSIPYETNDTVENGEQIINYDFLDVGIVLTVTPRITSNGFVTMDVSQTANEFVSYTSFNAPIVNQREAQTTVSVKDGQTIVLGGIIQDQVTDTVNKIPVLGDLPLIGPLFRSDNKADDKTELLVFLTPHVIKSAEDAQQLKSETEAELGKDARGLIPAAPPAPKDGGASSPDTVPKPVTTTTISPSNPNDVINMPIVVQGGGSSAGAVIQAPVGPTTPDTSAPPAAATPPDGTAQPAAATPPDAGAAAPTGTEAPTGSAAPTQTVPPSGQSSINPPTSSTAPAPAPILNAPVNPPNQSTTPIPPQTTTPSQ